MTKIEEPAGSAFEESALVRAIDRCVRTLRAWSDSSVVMAAAAAWLPGVRPRIGQVLSAAALTHVALMVAIARPPSWHWAILPSLFLTAGVVLIVTAKPDQRQR